MIRGLSADGADNEGTLRLPGAELIQFAVGKMGHMGETHGPPFSLSPYQYA
jgi:hypothetical protein